MIFALADHALDTAVDDQHTAYAAGCHAAVEGSPIERYAVFGSLTDGILLSMYGAHAVIGDRAVLVDGLFHLVAYLITVRQPLGRTDITGDQQLIISRYHTAAAASATGSSFADSVHHFYEVFIP